MTSIQSVDLAPQKHADRVVAVMLRELAMRRMAIKPTIAMAFFGSKDGGPRAQKRMADRIKQAGAVHVELTPGKRGKYQLIIHEVSGWNPVSDQEITILDPDIPDKPWLAYVITIIDRGRDKTSRPVLFITHHCLSRAAQRFGLKTTADMMALAQKIWIKVHADKLDDNDKTSWDRLFNPPPQGHRIALDHSVTAVLQRHDTREALVCATFLTQDKED